MKKSMKFVAAFVLMCLSLSTVTPKVAKADFYVKNEEGGRPIFATDSYVLLDGQRAWAYSANYECEGSNQSVRVNSTINLRDSSTGEFTRRIYSTKSASGYDAYAEANYDLTYMTEEIYYVSSVHDGKWKGQSQREYTSDSI